jgi:predicted 3-demethylubiquinone-9 3-methyltransferase (glyoxalase superfamily)
MAAIKQRILPFLWFDREAEEAAKFYVSIFDNSRITHVSRYGKAGREVHGKEAGSVLTVEFELEGLTFVALNGGPQYTFTEAISFQVMCESQAEIDFLWDRLSAGGEESRCGWLKDRYGLSWQIVPSALAQLLTDTDPAKSERAMLAMLAMKKLDLDALRRAHAGI